MGLISDCPLLSSPGPVPVLQTAVSWRAAVHPEQGLQLRPLWVTVFAAQPKLPKLQHQVNAEGAEVPPD